MVAVAFGIIIFFVQVEAPLATAPRPVPGNVLAVLSGICYALTLLGIRWIARDTNPSDTTVMKAVITGNLLACLICLPWALPVVSGLGTNWLLIAYLGLFQIALAYLLVTVGMRRVTATEAALLILVEPVLNPIWVCGGFSMSIPVRWRYWAVRSSWAHACCGFGSGGVWTPEPSVWNERGGGIVYLCCS